MSDRNENMSEATGRKYGKVQPVRGVLGRFPLAILAIARISEYGTKKHEVPLEDLSYRDLPDAEAMYEEAEVRHLLAEKIDGCRQSPDGQECTPAQIIYHKGQKAWNALADLEIFMREHDIDPRDM